MDVEDRDSPHASGASLLDTWSGCGGRKVAEVQILRVNCGRGSGGQLSAARSWVGWHRSCTNHAKPASFRFVPTVSGPGLQATFALARGASVRLQWRRFSRLRASFLA